MTLDNILELINKFILIRKGKYFYIPSLSQEFYLNAILFDYVIGNLSSNIIEVTLMKPKVLNIGQSKLIRYIFRKVMNGLNDSIYITHALQKIFLLEDIRKFDLHGFEEEYCSNSPSNQIVKILMK